jgi:ribosomal-protein-alanine N-acetyltransferase
MYKILYETDRLIIRYWQDSDYKDLYEYASDEEVTKFLSFDTYKTYDDAKSRISSVLDQMKNNEVMIDYPIVLKSENKVIGSIGIVDYTEKNFGQIEIGYILNRNYWGNGYMQEALQGMFKNIKERHLAKRIVLKHDLLNERSGNVMKRSGMTFEGVLRKAGDENHIHSRYDVALYSILEEEIV